MTPSMAIQTRRELIIMVADKNANGRIDFEDIKILIKELIDSIKNQFNEQHCARVAERVEKSKIPLRYRPILNQMHKSCTGN